MHILIILCVWEKTKPIFSNNNSNTNNNNYNYMKNTVMQFVNVFN